MAAKSVKGCRRDRSSVGRTARLVAAGTDQKPDAFVQPRSAKLAKASVTKQAEGRCGASQALHCIHLIRQVGARHLADDRPEPLL
jgi:hypothetical protein